MFMFHIAEALLLISLTMGAFFYVWACNLDQDCRGRCCAKYLGVLVVVLSLFSLACTFYSGYRSWQSGYMGYHHGMMMKPHGQCPVGCIASDKTLPAVDTKTTKSAS